MQKTQKFSNLIQLNAESLGIKSLDNEIIDYLNIEIEEKMKLILRQAQKFIRITKRKTLKVDDLSHALKLYNLDDLLGYDSYSMIDYEKIENVKGLWRIKQNVIDIEDYLSKPMAVYPMQPFPHFYWFAIDGKRPNIPENFIRNDNKTQDIQKIRQQQKSQSNFLLGLDPSPDNMAKSNINNNDVSNNINVENNNNNNIINNNEFEKNNVDNNNNENTITFGDNKENCFSNNKDEQNQKINHVIHNISKDLQIFFENFIQRFKNEMNSNKLNTNNPYLYLSPEMQTSIEIIRTNPGLVELVPYIINFLMMQYENYANDIKVYQCILHFVSSIVNNQYFFIEPYLHQILILLLSCILYDFNNNEIKFLDPILRLKFFAIKILKQIIINYEIKYHNLQFQLSHVFTENLNFENQNYFTIFGAVEGLKMVGPVFLQKAFYNQRFVKSKDNKELNDNLKKFLSECENDKEICNSINGKILKIYNIKEEDIKDNNDKPKFSNVDSLFGIDIDKRKKFLLLYSYQAAIKSLNEINI